jgi:3',5'-cyclic AMP phosphodiesterase CpdA
MKTIAHISDLHFGRVDDIVAEGLLADLQDIAPDLVVISGDLTQRARRSQFEQAKVYLEKIIFPKLVIPGNHDIPLFDLIRRFLSPLARYKKYISDNLSPEYIDDEVFVYGVNTARSFTWKSGRISLSQIARMKNRLCSDNNSLLKIVVTHHPFIPPPESSGIKLVGRAVKALDVIDECSVDILLSGHLHESYSADIRKHYLNRKRSLIAVQAGTAISNRTRDEPNTYNIIRTSSMSIEIEERQWNNGKFDFYKITKLQKENDEWKPI